MLSVEQMCCYVKECLQILEIARMVEGCKLKQDGSYLVEKLTLQLFFLESSSRTFTDGLILIQAYEGNCTATSLSSSP